MLDSFFVRLLLPYSVETYSWLLHDRCLPAWWKYQFDPTTSVEGRLRQKTCHLCRPSTCWATGLWRQLRGGPDGLRSGWSWSSQSISTLQSHCSLRTALFQSAARKAPPRKTRCRISSILICQIVVQEKGNVRFNWSIVLPNSTYHL